MAKYENEKWLTYSLVDILLLHVVYYSTLFVCLTGLSIICKVLGSHT